jgi:hypothetical protein
LGGLRRQRTSCCIFGRSTVSVPHYNALVETQPRLTSCGRLTPCSNAAKPAGEPATRCAGTETSSTACSEARVPRVLFYGVVSTQTEKAIELFLEREQAETFIAEVDEDEPDLAALLRVEPVEL